MRFEGKHNYFKDLAHRVKCFKNIAKTLATRHQHLMCYYLAPPWLDHVCACVCAYVFVFVATIEQYQYLLHVHVQTAVITCNVQWITLYTLYT